MALYAVRGGEGPTWSVAEVRSLLQLAQRSFKLCRPFSWHEGPILEDLKKLEKEVARAAAARPGAQRLPQCCWATVLLGHLERVALPFPLSPQLPRVPGGGLEAGSQGGVRTAGGAARRRRLGGRCGCQAMAAVQRGGQMVMQFFCLPGGLG